MTQYNDERFLSRPEIPQYGQEQTCCRVGLPVRQGILKCIGKIFLLTIPVVLSITATREHFPNNQPIQFAIVFSMVAGMTGLGYWWITGKQYTKREEALFVFDGGVHLNEIVHYTVPCGNRLEFCTGLRQVSLPWRVLKRLKLTETKCKGASQIEASLQIPDGRSMFITTIDGPESIIAIKTLQEKLGTVN